MLPRAHLCRPGLAPLAVGRERARERRRSEGRFHVLGVAGGATTARSLSTLRGPAVAGSGGSGLVAVSSARPATRQKSPQCPSWKVCLYRPDCQTDPPSCIPTQGGGGGRTHPPEDRRKGRGSPDRVYDMASERREYEGVRTRTLFEQRNVEITELSLFLLFWKYFLNVM